MVCIALPSFLHFVIQQNYDCKRRNKLSFQNMWFSQTWHFAWAPLIEKPMLLLFLSSHFVWFCWAKNLFQAADKTNSSKNLFVRFFRTLKNKLHLVFNGRAIVRREWKKVRPNWLRTPNAQRNVNVQCKAQF